MITYTYEIEGSASGGQTWKTTGTVEGAGDFTGAVYDAIGDSFVQLTKGKAIYGRPGVGCSGPYRMTKMTIRET